MLSYKPQVRATGHSALKHSASCFSLLLFESEQPTNHSLEHMVALLSSDEEAPDSPTNGSSSSANQVSIY